MWNGRRLSPPRDVPPAARKRVPSSAAGGSQTRWRQGQKKSGILLSGKISDSFDSRGGEQPRRGVADICESRNLRKRPAECTKEAGWKHKKRPAER